MDHSGGVVLHTLVPIGVLSRVLPLLFFEGSEDKLSNFSCSSFDISNFPETGKTRSGC